MRILSAVYIFLVSIGASAQAVSRTAPHLGISDIPEASASSVADIASYIRRSFTDEDGRARAIFTWVTNNIRYDVSQLNRANPLESSVDRIRAVLKTRQGVCMHYAELYNALALEVGLESYVVPGYVKLQGRSDVESHMWVAVRIDSQWYLVDPTWGAGYLQGGSFVKSVNTFYYKTKPEELIKTHFPFDPIWQLLSNPISAREFDTGRVRPAAGRQEYSLDESLSTYGLESELERLVSSNSRIKENGVSNKLVAEYLRHNKQQIDYLVSKQQVESYNRTAEALNELVGALNRFVDFRNRQFTPAASDTQVRLMVQHLEEQLKVLEEKVGGMKPAHSSLVDSVADMRALMKKIRHTVDEQRAFVDRYLSTPLQNRRELFYR